MSKKTDKKGTKVKATKGENSSRSETALVRREKLVMIRLTKTELDSFKATADKRGLALSTWARMVCLSAAISDVAKES